jgi:hypothetical protein
MAVVEEEAVVRDAVRDGPLEQPLKIRQEDAGAFPRHAPHGLVPGVQRAMPHPGQRVVIANASF